MRKRPWTGVFVLVGLQLVAPMATAQTTKPTVAEKAALKDGCGIAVRPLKNTGKSEGDQWGNPLPMLRKDGPSGRYFMAAPLGTEFGLDLIVPEGERVEFAITIDGVSILDGKEGSSSSRGYVATFAERDGENVIPGWRRGNDKVARFVFTPKADSYAALTDRKENVGVIGVKVYAERRILTRGGSRGTSKGIGEGHDTGTGYGREAQHQVDSTEFERDRLVAEFTIEYASAEALARVGIVIPPLPSPSPLGDVNPFPGDKKGPTVPPPAGWKP